MIIEGYEIDGRRRMRRKTAATCVAKMMVAIKTYQRVLADPYLSPFDQIKLEKKLADARSTLRVLEQTKVTTDW